MSDLFAEAHPSRIFYGLNVIPDRTQRADRAALRIAVNDSGRGASSEFFRREEFVMALDRSSTVQK